MISTDEYRGSSEQRGALRHQPGIDVYALCRLIGLDGSNKRCASQLKDYSASGVKLHTHEPMAVGQQLSVFIHLESEDQEYLLVGEIKWCLEIDNVPTYQVGVRFLEQDPDALRNWHELFMS